MKKFLLIPVVLGLVCFVLLGCLNRQIEVIKFPEPSGAVIGVIERDFDGNGHDRYLTLGEFESLDLKKVKVREIVIQSAESGKYWIEELSKKKALLISASDALSAVYKSFGFSYDYEDYSYTYDEYKYHDYDYDYEVPEEDPPVEI